MPMEPAMTFAQLMELLTSARQALQPPSDKHSHVATTTVPAMTFAQLMELATTTTTAAALIKEATTATAVGGKRSV